MPRADNVAPFHVMDVIAAANAHQAALPPGAPHVIHMEMGQPGTGAPQGAVRTLQAALSAGRPMGYTETFGLPSLRERLARHYRDWYGADVPRSRIAVVTGASGAFPLAFLAAFDPGDRVALAAPYYPPYVNILRALGIEPVILPCGPDTRFQPTPELLDRLDPPPDGLIVASPCNPVGSMLHPDEFAALAAWCAAHDTRLVSDEIYHGLTYGQPLSTAASVEGAIVINSFSKYFSMTGWRIGWMVLPDDLLRPVERLAQNLFISPPHASQVVAEAALDCHEELQANVAAYRQNRDFLLGALPRAGFDRLSPAEGAFYIYADISARTEDSAAFVTRMLSATGVAAAPGIDFDAARGHHFLRLRLLRHASRHARRGAAPCKVRSGVETTRIREAVALPPSCDAGRKVRHPDIRWHDRRTSNRVRSTAAVRCLLRGACLTARVSGPGRRHIRANAQQLVSCPHATWRASDREAGLMRILIVDDQEFLCEAFARYLETEQVHFSGTSINAVSAYTLADALASLNSEPHIDFVFLDLGLGGDCVGASTLQKFQLGNPRHVPVVVFTGMDLSAAGTIDVLRECLFDWNALGILPKGVPLAEVFIGLSRLLANERWMPNSVFQAMATHLPQSPARHALGLAPREWQVAQCLARGLSNKEIANEMKLSPGYVAQVTAQIYSKLQVSGRAKAIIKMRESGAIR